MKNGATPDIPHRERTERRTFWNTFLPLTMAGLGGGWWGGTTLTHSWGRELHQAPPDKIFLWRAHSFEPNLLIYMWFYWQGHQYLWVMSCCSPETDSAHLCVLCGPDSCGQCDLFRVILWTTGRWQLKNESLKALCSKAAQRLAY